MTKKFFAIFLMLLILLSSFARIATAQADDVIIQGDGQVILVVNSDGSVLAAQAPKESPKNQPDKPTAQQESKPSSPPKIVPLVPAHTQSTVHINAPINSNKKIQVVVTTPAAPSITTPLPNPNNNPLPKNPSLVPSTPPSPSQNGLPTNPPSSAPVSSQSTFTKIVDQVVAQGANGEPVITIKSDKINQLTILQGSTQVTTLLPLQVDNITHSLSVSNSVQAPKVSVLPNEAIKGILDKGLLDSKSVKQANISLTMDETGVAYNVESNRKGKLFGIFDLQTPVAVKFSAQTGKVVKSSQSPLFTFFGKFIN